MLTATSTILSPRHIVTITHSTVVPGQPLKSFHGIKVHNIMTIRAMVFPYNPNLCFLILAPNPRITKTEATNTPHNGILNTLRL